jgi:poly-gamma-glutamate capsule biosynthesis protein CapA/YwtB (metallophosphatase superfamily)
MPDNVNPQITDAITQTNVKVLAEAPAQAMAAFYQMMAAANGMAAQNAVSNQQNLNQLNATIVAKAISIIEG